MFSLLMRGNVDEWDIPVGQVVTQSFPIARFLEYTEQGIQSYFTPITLGALASLSTFPAVFMSEIFSLPNNPVEQASVRVGVILNVIVNGKDLEYTFRFDHNLGVLSVVNRKAVEQAFEMERFEFHRTHWAIKRGDLNQALFMTGLAQPGHMLAQVPVPYVPPVPEPPAQQPTIIEDVEDYIVKVLQLPHEDDEEIFYRGHSDKSYLLAPTLFRTNASGGFKYRPHEDVMVRELLAVQSSIFASDQYMVDRLVRMQHFGLPTRMLDLTSNPLVGLYFCVSSPKFDANGAEIDGEVLIISTKKSNILFFDSDRVSCIANLSLMNDQEKNRMDTSLSMTQFNATTDCQKLIHFIRREKPYFENRIEPTDLERILFVRARFSHERIISQSGAFLMFGKDSILPETGRSDLSVKRFVIRNKAHLLKQLDSLNIKASTIYPGLDRAAADIAKKYEEA